MGNGRDASRTVLCVDGNLDTNLGLFVDGELEATWKVTTTEHMTADEARMRMAGLFDMLERDGRRAICDDAVIASVGAGAHGWMGDRDARAYRPTPSWWDPA